MEFTSSVQGERAIPSPSGRYIAGHEGNGIWCIRDGLNLEEFCRLQSASGTAKPLFVGDEWMVFWTIDTVLVYCLRERGATTGEAIPGKKSLKRNPNQPDGIIKEAKAIGIAGVQGIQTGDGDVQLVVTLKWGMGVRIWSVRQRHRPLLVIPRARCLIQSKCQSSVACIERRSGGQDIVAVYRTARSGWTLKARYAVPDGMFLDHLEFLPDSSDTLLGWQGVGNFQLAMFEAGKSIKVAADESIFAVEAVQFTAQLAVFTDQSGAFTLFNLLTRSLITRVPMDIDAIKQQADIVVYREIRSAVEEAHFDASFGVALGAVAKRSDCGNIIATASPCSRFLAIQAECYPNTVFIYNVTSLRFTAALLLAHPVSGHVWQPDAQSASPTVYCTTLNSDHVYAWQPEGAQCLPHPERGFRVEQVVWRPDGGCCVLRGKQQWCLAIRSY